MNRNPQKENRILRYTMEDIRIDEHVYLDYTYYIKILEDAYGC